MDVSSLCRRLWLMSEKMIFGLNSLSKGQSLPGNFQNTLQQALDFMERVSLGRKQVVSLRLGRGGIEAMYCYKYWFDAERKVWRGLDKGEQKQSLEVGLEELMKRRTELLTIVQRHLLEEQLIEEKIIQKLLDFFKALSRVVREDYLLRRGEITSLVHCQLAGVGRPQLF